MMAGETSHEAGEHNTQLFPKLSIQRVKNDRAVLVQYEGTKPQGSERGRATLGVSHRSHFISEGDCTSPPLLRLTDPIANKWLLG